MGSPPEGLALLPSELCPMNTVTQCSAWPYGINYCVSYGVSTMRLAVIIATADRRFVLSRTLAHLESQTRPPDVLVVSAPDNSHVDCSVQTNYEIHYVFGQRGSCVQRNLALRSESVRNSDVIVFFDDDFLPSPDYLECVVNTFSARPDWSVLTGVVVFDGVTGPGLDPQQGLELLRQAVVDDSEGYELLRSTGAYGCNMAFRTSEVGCILFDERLPLHGWQEDTDFSRRVARGRPIVRLRGLKGVHLGVKGGRANGLRVGYSQIANPAYLVRKGTGDIIWAINLICKNLLANAVLGLFPERHVDRVGRLKGNLIAIGHLARGRLNPEFILRL